MVGRVWNGFLLGHARKELVCWLLALDDAGNWAVGPGRDLAGFLLMFWRVVLVRVLLMFWSLGLLPQSLPLGLKLGVFLLILMSGRMEAWFGMMSLVFLVVALGCLHRLLVLVGSIALRGIWSCSHMILGLAQRDPGFIFLFQSPCRRSRGLNFGASSLLFRRSILFILGLTMPMFLVMLVGLLLVSPPGLLSFWLMEICSSWLP